MLEEVFKKIQEGELKELRLIIKADTVGSLEALKKSFGELSTPEVSVRIIHGDVVTYNRKALLLNWCCVYLFFESSIHLPPLWNQIQPPWSLQEGLQNWDRS